VAFAAVVAVELVAQREERSQSHQTDLAVVFVVVVVRKDLQKDLAVVAVGMNVIVDVAVFVVVRKDLRTHQRDWPRY